MTLYSLDIETSGLSSFSDRLLCIGVYNDSGGYLSFKDVESFAKWHKPTNQYIGHNFKFDVIFLRRLGLDLFDHFSYDTRSISTVLCPLPTLAEGQRFVHSLENLYIKLLGGSAYKVDRTNMESISEADLIEYNKMDCRITWDLFNHFVDTFLAKDWQFVEEWVMPATRYCATMEYNGIYVDQEGLKKFNKDIIVKRDKTLEELNETTIEPRRRYHEKCTQELSENYHQLLNKALVKAKDKEKARLRYETLFKAAEEKIEPFNWNSSVQLKWLLGEYYGLDLFNKRSKKETTDEGMLRSHAGRSEVCKILANYREYEKMVSTCIPALADNIQPDNRVHPSFNVGGTRTGRLSSSQPNVQQIPRGPLRSYVQPRDGHKFYVCDQGQIEVRIMAHLAGERELINAFKEGIDPYSVIAQKLLKIDCPVREIKERFKKERDVSKTAGLSILYGTGARKLQEVLNKELNKSYNLKECKDFIDNYRLSFPAIASYKARLEVELANQKVIYNLLGRPVYIENNDDLYMTALNTMVQGSASDLVIRAANEVYKRFPFVKPVMLIHDEMVFEIAEDKLDETLIAAIKQITTEGMEQLLQLSVPLKIEYAVAKEWEKP